MKYLCRVEVEYRTLVGLKCVLVEPGEQSVMTSGRTKMQVLHADSLASQNLVKEGRLMLQHSKCTINPCRCNGCWRCIC